MPAITLGYTQIEQQIRVIRRRRNWLTVQQAVYVCGGAILFGAALLVVLAVRAERLVFTAAFWMTLTAMLLTAGAALRSIWQRWIYVADTPRWIDRAGALDDRLATLVAHRGSAPPSRLMATLVSQLFALRYRWEPATLVPRRVPRSLYFFLSAVVALIAATFLERPPAAPQAFPHTTSVPHQHGPADSSGSQVARVPRRTSGAAQGVRGADAGDGRSTAPDHLRPGSRPREGANAESGPGPAGEMNATARHGRSGTHEPMSPGSSAAMAGDHKEPALPDQVQDMIRQALRQPPLDRDDAHAAQERLQAKRGKLGEQPSSNKQQEQDERGNGLSNQERRLSGNTATPPRPPADSPEGGRGTNRGGGAGQGAGGIYGAQGPAVGQENASRKFELKLTLLGQSSGATMEPQRSQRGGVNDLGIPAEQATGEVPLNPDQRDDEPLVRGEIPAEHETMIKRIFSRSE